MEDSNSNELFTSLRANLKALIDPQSTAWIALKDERHIELHSLELLTAAFTLSKFQVILENLLDKIEEDPESFNSSFFSSLKIYLKSKIKNTYPKPEPDSPGLVDDSELGLLNEHHELPSSNSSSEATPVVQIIPQVQLQVGAQVQILPLNPSSTVAPIPNIQSLGFISYITNDMRFNKLLKISVLVIAVITLIISVT